MSQIFIDENEHGVSYVPLSFAVGGPHELKAAVPKKRHKIIGGAFSFSADATIDLLSAGSSLFGGPMTFPAKGGIQIGAGGTWTQTEEGEALNLTTTGAAPRGFLKILTE